MSIGSLAQLFAVRSRAQLRRDLEHITRELFTGEPSLALSTAGLFRPDLSVPSYLGLRPRDGVSPIFNLFDRTGGGKGFRSTVTRARCRDFRGGRLTYDEHDGTDFVCPPGTPVVAAAPGVLVAVRDTFFRGGLTACVDHGGVVTQYTHLARLAEGVTIGARLRRGEVLGASGCGGLDMISGFPWIPPHVHFMVWREGQPVDPFLRPDERAAPGTWLSDNDPQASDARARDDDPPALDELAIDREAARSIAARCLSPRVREELARPENAHPATQVALLEDSLHHDRKA